MNADCNITLDRLIIEYNNDILKALTKLGVEYKILFMFSDLRPAPGPTSKNRHRYLQRTIQYQTAIYSLRLALLKKSLTCKIDVVQNTIAKIGSEIKKAKEEEEKKDHVKYQMMQKDQRKNIRKTLEKVDKAIQELNAKANIQINKIYLGLTNDQENTQLPGQTMLEAGLSDQCIKFQKDGQVIRASVFGYYVSALNRLEVLFSFFSRL